MRFKHKIIFEIPGFVLFPFLVLLGCNSNSINQNDSTSKYNDMQRNGISTSDSNFKKGKLVSKSGEQLLYAFDNSSNTMIIFFNKETDTLKGQRMASGINYSNKNYTYTESHGTSTLYKDNVKVFEAATND